MEALTARMAMAAASVTTTLAPRSTTTTTSAITASAIAPSPHTSPAAAGVTPHSHHPPPQQDEDHSQHQQLPPTSTSFHSTAATNLLRSNPTYSSFHDYIWTPAHRPSRAHRAFHPPPSDAADDDLSLQLPTLDMAALRDPGRRAGALAELGRVTRAWGFFQLANHGVAQAVVDGAEAHARALFALPPERKLAALRRGDSTDGYSCGAVGANVLGDQAGGRRLENISWQETVHFSQYPADVVPRLAEVLFGPDGGNPDFSRAITEYLAALEQLGRELVELLTESLGVPPRTLTYTTNPADGSSRRVQLRNGLRINMYPPYPRPELTLGLVPHADPCLLTILHQDAVGGLQVLQQQRPGDGEPDRCTWVGVRPQRGCFVVNVGDMFQVYSNDRFPSALHRALVNATHDRLSMAVFVRPPMDARVAPFPELLAQGKGESAYREFTYAEYRSAALKNKTEGRSNLDRFRVAPPPPPRERGAAAAAAAAAATAPPLGVGS